MGSTSAIALFDLAIGSVAGVLLLYLLVSETFVVHYARFFRLITAGLFVYAVTGPIVGTLAPALIHAIHGTAALAIAVGLYDLVDRDRPRDADYATILGVDPVDAPGAEATPGDERDGRDDREAVAGQSPRRR